MTVETASTIAGLQPAKPSGSDYTNEGDDHLRLLKDVLQKQFPGENQNGFAIPITANESEINALSGVRTDVTIQDQINTLDSGGTNLATQLSAPPGMTMLIGTKYLDGVLSDPEVPSGWEAVTTVPDFVVRCTTPGSWPGYYGGQNAWLTQIKHTHEIPNQTLAFSDIPLDSTWVLMPSDPDNPGTPPAGTAWGVGVRPGAAESTHNHGGSTVLNDSDPWHLNTIMIHRLNVT